MINKIENLPLNIVGFRVLETVDEKDFTETVMPEVEALISKINNLNYLLVLDTSITNFTFGVWIKDALMGIKHLTKWNRAAIVTDVNGIRNFTEFFSKVMPGEFRAFQHKDLQYAIDWTSEKSNT